VVHNRASEFSRCALHPSAFVGLASGGALIREWPILRVAVSCKAGALFRHAATQESLPLPTVRYLTLGTH